jgi:hypothetical protein
MVTFLAYLEPVPRALDPLVATLQELARRGAQRIAAAGGPATASDVLEQLTTTRR